MRETTGIASRYADHGQQFRDPLFGLYLVEAVRHPFGQDCAHPHAGVEGGVRVLEDNLRQAPKLPQLFTTQTKDLAVVKEHLATGGEQ